MFPTYSSVRGRALEILQGGAEYGRAVAARAAEEEAMAAPADERYTIGEGCCRAAEVQARSFIVTVILILKAWRRRRSGGRIRVCAEEALRDSEAERRTHQNGKQKEDERREKKKQN
jgi:hypothetical protein